ncbi:hypothetical protein AB205_0026760, partial [Aquarana catesbeiana]
MIAAFKLPAFYNYPNLGAVSLLFILFGYATFAWMYLIAGTFKNAGMAFITYVCINLFIGINTIISSSVVYMLLQQTSTTDKNYQSLNTTYNVLTNFFKVFPQFCFGYGLIELAQQQAIQDQYAVFGSSNEVNIFDLDVLGYMFVAMTVQGTFCFLLRLLINDGIIYSVSNQLLQKLQLVQYKDRITASYSCGTRRKLSTALALIGRPSILLLDEPSSGMDPKTKRHLWKIISEEIQEKCAVVLTSHSMEECEALCTRLAIMVKGKFQCIGSLQHVKNRLA